MSEVRIKPAFWVRVSFSGDPLVIRSALASLGRSPSAPSPGCRMEIHGLDLVFDPWENLPGSPPSWRPGACLVLYDDPRIAADGSSAHSVLCWAEEVAAYVACRCRTGGAILHHPDLSQEGLSRSTELFRWIEAPAAVPAAPG